MSEKVLAFIGNKQEASQFALKNKLGDVSPKETIISLWSINENMLQSYRALFLTTESIFFAIALSLQVGIDLQKISLMYESVIIFLIALGFFWTFIWYKVTTWRGKYVSFYQWLINKIEEENWHIFNPFSNSHHLLKPGGNHSILICTCENGTYKYEPLGWKRARNKRLIEHISDFRNNKYKHLPWERNKSNFIVRPFRIRYAMRYGLPISFFVLWLALSIFSLISF